MENETTQGKEKFYMVYEVTNLINGKKYRGVHETYDLADNYLGSGNAIINSVKKHGKENFKREILELCESREQMYEREKSYVDKEWVNDPNTYNLTTGGKGDGWRPANKIQRKPISKETREKMSIASSGRKHTEESKRKMSKSIKTAYENPEVIKKCSESHIGKKHTEEIIRKIVVANKETSLKKQQEKIDQWNNFNKTIVGKEKIDIFCELWNVKEESLLRFINLKIYKNKPNRYIVGQELIDIKKQDWIEIPNTKDKFKILAEKWNILEKLVYRFALKYFRDEYNQIKDDIQSKNVKQSSNDNKPKRKYNNIIHKQKYIELLEKRNNDWHSLSNLSIEERLDIISDKWEMNISSVIRYIRKVGIESKEYFDDYHKQRRIEANKKISEKISKILKDKGTKRKNEIYVKIS